jgi:hypothetical protein
MPRRNDIQKILVIGIAVLILQSPLAARSQGIVDCVQNHKLKVGKISGLVVDPFGVAIPTSFVSATDQNGHEFTTHTDSQGEFALQVSSGNYRLKSQLNGLESSQVDLVIGRNFWRISQPKRLYVVLGLAGIYCPWVTTSKQDFEYNIRANKERSKELK